MPSFSKASLEKLDTCDPRLQMIFKEVVRYVDCTILCGHRGQKEQDEAFAKGLSKLKWPNGEHNKVPSRAVDVAPYPVKWGEQGTAEQRKKDIARFYFFAGYVKSVADNMSIKLRWGGDWDSDLDFNDQNFDDLPHFELID